MIVARKAAAAARAELAGHARTLEPGTDGTIVTVDGVLGALLLHDRQLCAQLNLDLHETLRGLHAFEALALHFMFHHGAHVRRVRQLQTLGRCCRCIAGSLPRRSCGRAAWPSEFQSQFATAVAATQIAKHPAWRDFHASTVWHTPQLARAMHVLGAIATQTADAAAAPDPSPRTPRLHTIADELRAGYRAAAGWADASAAACETRLQVRIGDALAKRPSSAVG